MSRNVEIWFLCVEVHEQMLVAKKKILHKPSSEIRTLVHTVAGTIVERIWHFEIYYAYRESSSILLYQVQVLVFE